MNYLLYPGGYTHLLPTGFTEIKKILWKGLSLVQVFHRGRWRERVAAGFTCIPGNPCIPVMYKTGRTDILFPPGGIGPGFFGVLHGDTLCRTDFHTRPAADTIPGRSVKGCCDSFAGSMAAEGDGMGTNIFTAHMDTQPAKNTFFIFQGETGDSNPHLVCQFPYDLHVG
jgi:hypothetical protein